MYIIEKLINLIFKRLLDSVFTITPKTQYVWINEIATFVCATINGYTLSINKPFGSQFPDYHESLVNQPEGGQQGTVSFNVTAESNGSSLRFIAETVDENVPVSPKFTDMVYAFSQGKLSLRYCMILIIS